MAPPSCASTTWPPRARRSRWSRRCVRQLADRRRSACHPGVRAPTLSFTPGATNMAVRLSERPVESARKLFGTDGIRGVANVWPMTSELMLKLGRAVAYLIKRGEHRHPAIIGKATPLSAYILDTAPPTRLPTLC